MKDDSDHHHHEKKHSSDLKMKMKMKKKKLENTHNKLRIKLKILHQNNQKQQEQEKKQEEEIKGSSSSSSASASADQIRVCPFCQKGFSSGKALGGHMRVHSDSSSAHQQHPKSNPNPNPSVDKFGCTLCGKEFRSEKSLFGHMRSHPDRQWRGMQPPSFESQPDLGSGGSGQVQVGVPDELPQWGEKGKRGRNQRGLEAAAGDLIMLGRGEVGGKRKLSEFEDDSSIGQKRVCFDSDELYYLQNSEVTLGKNNTSDHDHDHVDHQASPKNEQMGEEKNGNGKRVIEDFPTQQTLGGHRSTHNMEIKNNSFSFNAPTSIETHIHTHIHLPSSVYKPRPTTSVELKDETHRSGYIENEVVVNKDKVRNKSFITNQVPGDQTERKGPILDLDLNVAPPTLEDMEVEIDEVDESKVSPLKFL